MSRRPSRPILFRYRPAAAAQFVDLRSELVHFLEPRELSMTRGGWLETTLHAAAGVYAYKYRHADGSWHLDPENPRTVAVDGARNSVLVVDGTDEPVLHAPGWPLVGLDPSGLVWIRAALRRGAGHDLAVRWDEGHGVRVRRMDCVGDDDEHLLFEGRLPASARDFSYGFVLDDGRVIGAAGGASQLFTLRTSELADRRPQWWRDAVVYSVFVDRFRRGGADGRWPEALQDDRGRAGGDLLGVIEALPYLEDMGITVLQLGPIAASRSAHRYDAVDPRLVDPAIGGERALTDLLEAASRRGIRVMLDVVATHVHRDFGPFADVRARGPASPYWSWFRVHRWPLFAGQDPGYAHYQRGQWQEPLLRTDEPAVVAHLVETFVGWARLGIAGFRVDAAADLPISLLEAVSHAVRAVRGDMVVHGEVIPDNLFRYTAHALDAATDFAPQRALLDWLVHSTAGRTRLNQIWARRRYHNGPGWTRLAFTATHDQHRLLSLTGDARKARLGQLLVLMRPEIPLLYYGDEVGLATAEIGRIFEDVWPDRMPMPWNEGDWDQVTRNLVREAIALRKTMPALHRGDEQGLELIMEDGCHAPDGAVGLRRRDGEQVIDVLANGTDGAITLGLPAGAPSDARTLLIAGDGSLGEDGRSVTLSPWSAIVIERRASPATTAAWNDVIAAHPALVASAFATGEAELFTLPRRLYVTITERCNLRCAHCITEAPMHTRRGSARELAPWVIAALAEGLRATEYLGLSHGGESMVSPRLFELLDALAVAKRDGGPPVDVHLLTNGMLLTPEMLARLVGGGVNSLAISVDGASAAVNDRIRKGGELTRVIAHTRAAVGRRDHGDDLRVGWSTVVSRSALPEVRNLVELALELGLDWLKLEEMAPVGQFARDELVAPADPQMTEALAQARETARGTGLELVEHIAPPSGCPCDGDPDVMAFRAADDFANRAAFRPCRMLWEQAAIDPDGHVRPVDYDHDPIGNLLDLPLLSVWNAADLLAMRRTEITRRPAVMRAACIASELDAAPTL